MPNIPHDLFLLMSNLSHIKNRSRMITVFVEAINSFSPDFRVEYIPDSDMSGNNIENISTTRNNFGRFRTHGNPSEISPEFQILFQNAIQVLAIFLERLKQEKLLSDEKLMLKERVDFQVKELSTSEERFRLLVESSPLGISVNVDGVIVFANRALIKLARVSSVELIVGSKILDWLTDDSAAAFVDRLKSLQVDREPTAPLEIQVVCPDGDIIDCRVHTIPIIYGGKEAGYTVLEDISELKRLQRLESRAQRLEMAGSVAGQVAHDFNNLLGPLMAYPELIRDEVPANHSVHEYVDSIEHAAQRLSDINHQLLTLSRRGHYNQVPLDLNEVIKQVVAGFKPKTTFVIDTNYGMDLKPITGGASQLYRLILNLVQNASDATNNMGTLTITTEDFNCVSTSDANSNIPKGEYIRLTLSDTGCGIPEDVALQIFDPFFSTKKTNRRRGSGLGLSIVDAVTKDHNGYLEMESQVGSGTSFYLYFPITRESTNDSPREKTLVGTETILIVDDDVLQGDVMCRVLKKLGYTLATAESGEEAISILKETRYNLIILDMIIPPGIDGAETYQKILEFNPDQKAIIVSGFSETDQVLHAQALGAGEFVKKPIKKSTIATAVRRELDRKTTVTVE